MVTESLPGKIGQLLTRPVVNTYDAAYDLATVVNSYGKAAKTWKGQSDVIFGAAQLVDSGNALAQSLMPLGLLAAGGFKGLDMWKKSGTYNKYKQL